MKKQKNVGIDAVSFISMLHYFIFSLLSSSHMHVWLNLNLAYYNSTLLNICLMYATNCLRLFNKNPCDLFSQPTGGLRKYFNSKRCNFSILWRRFSNISMTCEIVINMNEPLIVGFRLALINNFFQVRFSFQ